MASVFEDLQLRYQGRKIEQDGSTKRTTLTFTGSYDLCVRGSETDYQLGMESGEYGTITSTSIDQDEGPFWKLTVVYEIDTITASMSSGSEEGPGHSELNARVMSNPLENHPNYKRKWNYNLYFIGVTPSEDIINSIWNNTTANTPYDYIWIYNNGATMIQFGQVRPPKPDTFLAYPDTYWVTCRAMTKPGQSYYMVPTYELIQYGKHKNKSDAGWAVSSKLGKTVKPSKGDFGIDKKLEGNWLCEGGTIRHNGKFWVSELTYVFSGNGRNWDSDIYD